MPSRPPSHFNLGFTAASLRPDLSRIIAYQYLNTGDWDATKDQILATNALQCRSHASAIRLERALRQRLQLLTDEQISLLAKCTLDERTLLAWLAAVKHSSFLLDFAAETLRSKLEMHDPVLRSSDWDRFFEEQRTAHPAMAELTASTTAKIRRVMLLMLREAGILDTGEALGRIQRPVVPPAINKVVRADHPGWLAAFLVPENEIHIPS